MKERQMEKTDKKKGKRRNNRVKALKGEKERTGLNRFYEKKREKENGVEECATADAVRRLKQECMPDPERRKQSLAEIRQNISKKTFCRTPFPGELLAVQIQYLSAGFWILQGIFIVAMILFVERASGGKRELADYLQWTSVIAAWMGVAGCSQLSRHFSRGMAELEQSCYFNLSQVWTIRMAFSGLVDIGVLTLCGGRIAERAKAPFGAVCVYILVPFVLANVCCLFFFTALRGGRSRYVQLAMAFVTGTLAAVPAATPGEAYAGARLWKWWAVLAAGAVFYLWQLRCIYRKIRRGEMVCWN